MTSEERKILKEEAYKQKYNEKKDFVLQVGIEADNFIPTIEEIKELVKLYKNGIDIENLKTGIFRFYTIPGLRKLIDRYKNRIYIDFLYVLCSR